MTGKAEREVALMFNSHLDSNVSLGLNILEGCINTNKKGNSHFTFGQDITEDNVADMLSCAFQTAEAMKNTGATGCYYQMAPMYHWSLCSAKRGPAYWDSIRMLHLLTKYVGNHTKKGEWPLPSAFRQDTQRVAMINGYRQSGEDTTMALSYVPEIDKYWLGANSYDVFEILREPVTEMLKDADTGGISFIFPDNSAGFKRWMKEKASTPEGYKIAATVFLVVFFPWRSSSLILTKPTTVIDWLLDSLGDTEKTAKQNRLSLLTYGPACIRCWIDNVKGEK